jgi:hypothetical protein
MIYTPSNAFSFIVSLNALALDHLLMGSAFGGVSEVDILKVRSLAAMKDLQQKAQKKRIRRLNSDTRDKSWFADEAVMMEEH